MFWRLWLRSPLLNERRLGDILSEKVFELLGEGCAGYFVYPFQNQEGNSHAGNFNETYLERRLKRKTLVELS